jgi:hypothetical protein
MRARGAAAADQRINCVHCKTCDIMDPYEVINWVPPESGGQDTICCESIRVTSAIRG